VLMQNQRRPSRRMPSTSQSCMGGRFSKLAGAAVLAAGLLFTSLATAQTPRPEIRDCPVEITHSNTGYMSAKTFRKFASDKSRELRRALKAGKSERLELSAYLRFKRRAIKLGTETLRRTFPDISWTDATCGAERCKGTYTMPDSTRFVMTSIGYPDALGDMVPECRWIVSALVPPVDSLVKMEPAQQKARPPDKAAPSKTESKTEEILDEPTVPEAAEKIQEIADAAEPDEIAGPRQCKMDKNLDYVIRKMAIPLIKNSRYLRSLMAMRRDMDGRLDVTVMADGNGHLSVLGVKMQCGHWPQCPGEPSVLIKRISRDTEFLKVYKRLRVRNCVFKVSVNYPAPTSD